MALWSNDGYCPICKSEVVFEARNEWLRDHYVCRRCGSIPRERALMHVLDTWFPQWQEMSIHESSPVRRGASVRLAGECRGYVPTRYFDNVPLGKSRRCIRCEDLERLTFPAASFDLQVTQDVMEHVFDPERAFREIARILKPGGAHVFTVPLVRKTEASRRRAQRAGNGEIEYLLDAQYHRNPISGKGSLVVMDWGYDICDFIHKASGMTTTMVVIDDLSRGIRAEYIEVLVSRKTAT